MKYDWLDYLNISKEMINTCSKISAGELRKDTLLRIAISRAYYAAFHKCLDYMKTYGDRLHNNGIHRDLIDNIDKYIQSNQEEVAMELDRAFRSRKKADYDDVFKGIEKEAAAMIVRVEKIISDISIRPAGPY